MWPINYAWCLLLYHYLHDILILSKYLNFLLNLKLGDSILFTEIRQCSEIPLSWCIPPHLPRDCVNIYMTLKSHNNSVITWQWIFKTAIINEQTKNLSNLAIYIHITNFVKWIQKKFIAIFFRIWRKTFNILVFLWGKMPKLHLKCQEWEKSGFSIISKLVSLIPRFTTSNI